MNARRAQFLSSISLIALKQYDEAFTKLKALQDAASSPGILNNLGVVQIRRGTADVRLSRPVAHRATATAPQRVTTFLKRREPKNLQRALCNRV